MADPQVSSASMTADGSLVQQCVGTHNGYAESSFLHSSGKGIETEEEMDMVAVSINLTKSNTHCLRSLRHSNSDALATDLRRRSTSVAEVKEVANYRLQEELKKAQSELKLKDEECEKLAKVRDQMGQELEELTACLFEEANNMVQDANTKRLHSEKLLNEANQKIEVLEAEVTALKTLVLTSTPSTPNKHLHPQIDNSGVSKKKENGKPFWKTHRRSTSHHEFTKEPKQTTEVQQEDKSKCNEIDQTFYEEFRLWREQQQIERNSSFLSRIVLEDMVPCLNFTNTKLSEQLKDCVESNNLTIEPIPDDSFHPKRCSLSESNRLCNYKIKLGEDEKWHFISEFCRNRIASVCDFYTYIRYIQQGLVKGDDEDVFHKIMKLRKQMALTRLGYYY